MRRNVQAVIKLMNPRAIPEPDINPSSEYAMMTMATGRSGEELFTVSGPIMEAYAKKHGLDLHVITGPSGPFPCGRKWEVYPYFKHYKRILWVDCDTVIDPRLDNMLDVVPVGRVGIHDDMPMLSPDCEWIENEYKMLCKSQKWEIDYPDVAWNTGVWVADKEHAFAFAPPQHPHPTQWCMEQWHITLMLHRAKTPVTALSSIYNWEWWVKRGEMIKPIPGVRLYHWAGLYWNHAERFRQMCTMARALYPDMKLPEPKRCAVPFIDPWGKPVHPGCKASAT